MVAVQDLILYIYATGPVVAVQVLILYPPGPVVAVQDLILYMPLDWW